MQQRGREEYGWSSEWNQCSSGLAGQMPDDLNLKQSQRISAVLSCTLIPTIAVALLFQNLLATMIAGVLLLVLVLNRELYRFFAAHHDA
jgi:hypothetical protein